MHMTFCLPAHSMGLYPNTNLKQPISEATRPLSNAVQTSSVDGDLVVDLVRFVDDAVDVLVLAVNFSTHGPTELVQSSRAAVDCIPTCQVSL